MDPEYASHLRWKTETDFKIKKKSENYENAHASVNVSHRERVRMQLRMDPHKLRSWTKFRT